MTSLALLSPRSLGAGMEAVGWSPRLARLGLVSDREAMNVTGMRCHERRQPVERAMSDETACAGPRRMASWLARLSCVLPLLTGAWAIAADDPLHSPACLRARAELDAAIAAPDAKRSPRLERARRAALHDCLGTDSGTRQRTGAPEPPQVVPSTLPPTDVRAPPPARGITLPPAALDIPRPATITTCDAGGCWDSTGRRLNQMGPQLVGPRGLCTTQGGLVTCP